MPKSRKRRPSKREAQPPLLAESRQAQTNRTIDLRKSFEWVGNITTAYGLIPPAIVGVLTGAFAWIVEWQAPLIIVVGLIAAFLAFALLWICSSKLVGYVIIGLLAFLAANAAQKQYNNFQLTFNGVVVGLHQASVERDAAQGASVELQIINNNKIDLYFRSNRRVVVIHSTTQETDAKTISGKLESGQMVGVRSDPIIFLTDLNPREIPGGRFDYDFCYGRTLKTLNKHLSLEGTFELRMDDLNRIETVHNLTRVEEGKCGRIDIDAASNEN